MLTPKIRETTRGLALTLFFVAATTIAAMTSGALAATVQISGTHGEADIKSHCDSAGGVYTTNDGGRYGCYAKGGEIECQNGKCVGRCETCGKGAAIAHKGDPILGVLSGTTLKAGTNARTKTTAAPTRVKRPVADSGGTSNTENHQGKKK
jgi:hypothetical protein